MTQLRRQMSEELERRNYTDDTAQIYLRAVEEYARYFNTPPDQLGPEHIREYQAHLFRDRKLAANTVAQHLTASGAIGAVSLCGSACMCTARRASAPPCARRCSSPASRVDAARAERHRRRTHGGSRSRRQGPQRPRRNVVSALARRRQRARSFTVAQAQAVAVSRRLLAHRRLPDQHQHGLERLPSRRRSGRHHQAAAPAHSQALLRHALTRSRSGLAHHPDAAGSQRPGADGGLSAPIGATLLRAGSGRHRLHPGPEHGEPHDVTRTRLRLAQWLQPGDG